MGELIRQPPLRLDIVVSHFPRLTRVVGHARGPLITAGGRLSAEAAEMILRMALLPVGITKTISAGHKAILKAKAFVAGLVLQSQVIGLAVALTMFGSIIRRSQDGNRASNIVCVGISHSWDESKHMLRERRAADNKYLRQPAQGVGHNILCQTSAVHAIGVVHNEDGTAEVHHRGETWLVSPLELAGKTTDFLARGVLDSVAVPLEDLDKMRVITSKVSCMVLSFWGDGAPTNRRFLKHLVGLAQQEGFPANVLIDVSQKCLLQQLHRVKTRQLEGHALVSMAYCFGRLVRTGCVLGHVTEHITQYVADNLKRVVKEPPPEKVQHCRRVFDLLFEFGAGHHVVHNVSGTSVSSMVRDVELLLRMDAGSMLDRASLTLCVGIPRVASHATPTGPTQSTKSSQRTSTCSSVNLSHRDPYLGGHTSEPC